MVFCVGWPAPMAAVPAAAVKIAASAPAVSFGVTGGCWQYHSPPSLFCHTTIIGFRSCAGCSGGCSLCQCCAWRNDDCPRDAQLGAYVIWFEKSALHRDKLPTNHGLVLLHHTRCCWCIHFKFKLHAVEEFFFSIYFSFAYLLLHYRESVTYNCSWNMKGKATMGSSHLTSGTVASTDRHLQYPSVNLCVLNFV